MTIKVTIKQTRIDPAVNWHNRDNNGEIINPITIDTGSGTFSMGRSETSLREYPDDLTLITTRVWEDLDTYKSSLGNVDEILSENSDYTARILAEGTYNEDNNITVIRYIYDADDTLISRQKRINKIEWEDYSE